MASPPVPDDVVLASVEAIRQYGSALAAAQATGMAQTTLLHHLRYARDRGLTDLPPAERRNGWVNAQPAWTYPREIPLDVRAGTVLVGGDMHAWTGEAHPIWTAFCDMARWLEPAVIIMNGDLLDGARVSRHPRLRGQNAPSIGQEIDAVRERLNMLPRGSERVWTLGNHDLRIGSYLANQAPELDDFAGDLSDRFSDWTFCYSAVVNGGCEIRHRFRSGVHSRWNNSLHTGRHTITSHTHQLGVTPVVDRNGTRWGVEVGMLDDPQGPQFEYGEGAANRHEVGFAVLTFDTDGDMLEPELCRWYKGQAMFRGAPVKPRFRVKAGAA